ncbi:MucR family transcriptional regulator [Mesorhizobium sp. B2-3-4]|uniref:MucR family transcriptional regulator n=1 Tax=Mesorhizobium sp. B2-3-4 TaxID=2589959 RepID=UPI00112A4492|nr:MucR family transcriptional regulator [Mesorhizobium sp. B2-3-4]TPM34287.1 transcriptional regulator [Mesorhizobium sp. B2-3-4]
MPIDLADGGGAYAGKSGPIDPIIAITADIVSSYVSNNPVPAADLPDFIGKIHASIRAISDGVVDGRPDEIRFAVPVKKSVTPDFIICLEDGRRFKSLKRHIETNYGLTPDQYRKKWNLPSSYPMVAPNYSATRSKLAKSMGLGRKAKGGA